MKKKVNPEVLGNKIGRALVWVVILAPFFLFLVICGMGRAIYSLEDRVYNLEIEVSSHQDQIDSLLRSEDYETMSYVPRDPNSPGSDITIDDLYPPTNEELEILAKVVYQEARGVTNKEEQAAVIWCILNRVDDGYWGNTIKEVATYPKAFAWIPNTPVKEEFLLLAADVCERWNLEKAGASDVGRTLPKEYLYFTGDGGKNTFTTEWKGGKVWDWDLASPYWG